MSHFVKKMNIPNRQKNAIIRELRNRKTPQLRPQFETLMLEEKPRKGTFIDNWIKYKAGLIDVTKGLNGASPTTLMTVEKPIKEPYNTHLTVKPIRLLMHLIELFTMGGQTVLDPFIGSGTTAVACVKTGRHFIGIEKEQKYVDIANKRIKDELRQTKLNL